MGNESRQEASLLLIGIDLGGPPGYLRQTATPCVDTQWKGGVFFLHLLMDALVRLLLERLELSGDQLLSQAGGSCCLLAPDTPLVRRELKKIVRLVEKNFFSAFGTSLYAVVAAVPLQAEAPADQAEAPGFGAHWEKLLEACRQQKERPYAAFLAGHYDLFFEPTGGQVPTAAEAASRSKKSRSSRVALGETLRGAQLLLVSKKELPCWRRITHLNPAKLGYYYYVPTAGELNTLTPQMKACIEEKTILLLNDTPPPEAFDNQHNRYESVRYAGLEADGKRFCHLADYESGRADVTRLGVLRMDVDNLKQLLSDTLFEQGDTLREYVDLSRSLAGFFSSRIDSLWKEGDRGHAQIIYSGGDELLVVGSWQAVIALAEQIREAFRQRFGGTTSLSISAGIAVVPPDYPLLKAAELSAAQLTAAKGHRAAGQDKNSLSFMDMPLNWDEEYPQVKALKERIVELTLSGELSKAFIPKLLTHAGNAGFEKHVIKMVKTYWMLAYDLSRMKGQKKDAANRLIDQYIKEVCSLEATLGGQPILTHYHPLELWAFAARWAGLEIRINQFKIEQTRWK
jgi:CRISPR-associated protein Csm1